MAKSYRVIERSFINGRLYEAGAIVQLHVDSPGSNLKEVGDSAAAAVSTQAPAPGPKAFTAVHRGGGHWAVEDAAGEVVGDFRGTKEEAQAEAERLNAGDPDLTDQGGSDLPDA